MKLIILVGYLFQVQIEAFTYMDPIRDLNQKCIFNNTQSGRCKRASDCAEEVISEADLERSTICKYEGLIPVFCCPFRLRRPPVDERIQLRKASRMCHKYIDENYPDEKMEEPDMTEVMEKTNLESSFPHVAQVGRLVGNDVIWDCGGTLISPQFLLTAGHCTEKSPSVIRMIGDKEKKYSIENIFHFENSIDKHDIAIIQVTITIEFNKKIRPSCLSNPAEENWNWIEEDAIVSGFGYKDKLRSMSDRLMAIKVRHVNNETCSNAYSSSLSINMDKQFCYGNVDTYMTTCMGDSGSALEHLMRPLTVVIGLVATGLGNCAARNSPTIYTRVSYYIDWIEEIVWPEKSL